MAKACGLRAARCGHWSPLGLSGTPAWASPAGRSAVRRDTGVVGEVRVLGATRSPNPGEESGARRPLSPVPDTDRPRYARGGHMRRSIVASVAGAVLIACGFLIAIALATRSTTGRVPAGRATGRVPAGRVVPHGLDKIKHFVFIIKENHSFDNYFGRFPGDDGATTGRTSTGAVVPLVEAPDQVFPDISHSARAAE